jgi:spore coat protein CotH
MPGRGGAVQLTSRDPIYVAVTVEHGGRTWPHVGLRYKGNSSLVSAVSSNNGKIPFRLDFDRYEDDHPETRNQRFYGFEKLTFSSNFGDDSQMREVIAVEIFRDRGVPAARAAFYRVLVDVGEGFEYWGLYAMIEDPSDVMLQAQFGSADGNLYKPDGPNWTEFHEDGFPKKTNEREGDFSDVEAAIAALHAPQTDARAWRKTLEATFDADGFLRWLAVNTAIQNWDVYGAMAHNYYLYGDPAQNGRLRWIPWDNNFSLGASPGIPGGRGIPGAPPVPAGLPPGPALPPGAALPGQGGAPFGMGRGMMFGNSTDVLHTQVGEQWPLIQRLLADDVYAARYRDHLADALDGLYSLETIEGRLRELHALIAPFVAGDRGERPTHTTISAPEAFEASIEGPNGLIAFIRSRHQTIRAALDGVSNR